MQKIIEKIYTFPKLIYILGNAPEYIAIHLLKDFGKDMDYWYSGKIESIPQSPKIDIMALKVTLTLKEDVVADNEELKERMEIGL